MKQFLRHRTSKELKAKLSKLGIDLSMREHKKGSDYVSFSFLHGGGKGDCVVSVVNGRFFGTFYPAKGPQIFYTSDSSEHDKKPWMDWLLSLIYIEKPTVQNGLDRTTSGAIGQP